MIIEVSVKTGTAFVSNWSKRVTSGETIPEAERVKLLVKTDRGSFVAIDNTAGECYVEDFKDKNMAIGWLNGEFEL